MAAVDTAAVVLHVTFAGLWTGAVALYAWRVHPGLVTGSIDAVAADRVLSGLQWLTRLGALVFLGTGGYLASEQFVTADLVGTLDGQLVLAMLVLWLVLVALVEVSAGRMRRAEGQWLSTAARESTTLVRLAGVVAVALLVVGGLVAA